MNPSTVTGLRRPRSPNPVTAAAVASSLDESLVDSGGDGMGRMVGRGAHFGVHTKRTQNPGRRRHNTGGGGSEDDPETLMRPLHAPPHMDRSGSWGGVNESDEELEAIAFSVNPETEGVRGESSERIRTSRQRRHADQPNGGPAEQSADPSEENFRRRLAFFFMDPVQKYRARRQFPWKLGIQFLKIFLVTAQVLVFGNYRYAHTKYYGDNKIAFEHLFLKGWESVREINSYPPATGAFALYRRQTFYDYFDYMAHTFARLPEVTVNPVFANTSFDFCIEQFAEGQVYPNLSWTIDFTEMEHSVRCLPIDKDDLFNISSKDYLVSKEFDVPWDTVTWMSISFTLHTVTYTKLGPLLGPECFAFVTKILFDNSDYDGQIPIKLNMEPHRMLCPQPRVVATAVAVVVRILNYAVILICAASFLLCLRALVRAQMLRREAEQFFRTKFGWSLTHGERMEFLNGWYIVILINDLLIIVGSIMKELIETRHTFGDLWDFSSLFLGTGNLLVWIGTLRYLGFFQAYNVLILTMKGALPNVLRFLLCAALIYLGFVFCGWIILGPYNFKFRTILSTSECLFSLINGDDMFATFSAVPETSRIIWSFSRLYLYVFISLFIYVVLSLFISIIMDTYEIIKDCYKNGFPAERMHDYYRRAKYEPDPAIFGALGVGGDIVPGTVRTNSVSGVRNMLFRNFSTLDAFATEFRGASSSSNNNTANERTPLLS